MKYCLKTKRKNMAKTSKIQVSVIIVILLFSIIITPSALAQGSLSNNLEVNSWALKGGVFSFLNNLQHKVRYLVTWNPRVQTKMNLTKANESLAVAQAELAKEVQSPEVKEKFNQAIEQYNSEMTKIAERSDKFKNKVNDDSKLEAILDKYTNNQLIQQTVLNEIAELAPSDQQSKITSIKDNTINGFATVLTNLEDETKITERLQDVVYQQNNNNYKELGSLELLKALENKVSPETKKDIERAKTATLFQLNQKIKNLPVTEIGKLKPVVSKLKIDSQIQSFISQKIDDKKIAEITKSNSNTQIPTEILNAKEKYAEISAPTFPTTLTPISYPPASLEPKTTHPTVSAPPTPTTSTVKTQPENKKAVVIPEAPKIPTIPSTPQKEITKTPKIKTTQPLVIKKEFIPPPPPTATETLINRLDSFFAKETLKKELEKKETVNSIITKVKESNSEQPQAKPIPIKPIEFGKQVDAQPTIVQPNSSAPAPARTPDIFSAPPTILTTSPKLPAISDKKIETVKSAEKEKVVETVKELVPIKTPEPIKEPVVVKTPEPIKTTEPVKTPETTSSDKTGQDSGTSSTKK